MYSAGGNHVSRFKSKSLWELETPPPDYSFFADGPVSGGHSNSMFVDRRGQKMNVSRTRSLKDIDSAPEWERRRPNFSAHPYPDGPRRAVSQRDLVREEIGTQTEPIRHAQSTYIPRTYNDDMMTQGHQRSVSHYNIPIHRDRYYQHRDFETRSEYRPSPSRQEFHRGDRVYNDTRSEYDPNIPELYPPPLIPDSRTASQPLPPKGYEQYPSVTHPVNGIPHHMMNGHMQTPDPDYDFTPPPTVVRNGRAPIPPPRPVITSEKQMKNGRKYEMADVFARNPVDGMLTGEPAPSYIILSVITTILCFFPVGLVAIYFSLKTKKYNKIHLFEKAWRSSKWAWIAALIAAMCGCTIIATFIALGILKIL